LEFGVWSLEFGLAKTRCKQYQECMSSKQDFT
jgi:hypothetical protein